MLVVKDRKTLLLNLSDPGKVTSIIPGSKVGKVRGQEIVAVPHTDDVVRVLRNIGIAAPGPILSYYSFPGMYTPFVHQRETSEFATLHPRAFILNDMGTGKTASVLWAFDYLRKQGIVDWLLVISPLSTLERAWGDEIFRNFADMTFGVMHGTADRRMKVLNTKHDVYIINHDGIKSKSLLAAIRAKAGKPLVVVDELAAFRNASTDRWKCANWLVNGHRQKVKGVEQVLVPPLEWVWGLTGTPIPTAPTDAWGECRLITPGTVPPYFGAFRDMTMKKVSTYKWLPRADALDVVHRAMQPAIRFAREDCIDLPPTTFVTREVEMTADQKRMYKDMLARFKAEHEGTQIIAMNEAVKIGKLLQIVCGVAYKGDDNVVIPAKPRVDEVMEVIEEAGGKVIVFVPLTGALEHLAEAVGKEHSVAVVHGATSKAKRDTIFHDFMLPAGPRVLVAQPGTMAHGLSLTAANTIVWFAPVHSAEIYQQANARIVRPGQKSNTLIVRIQGSELERRMYAKLESRETMQGTLLDLF
jgi:SNF2 family DNA or RNA helicase